MDDVSADEQLVGHGHENGCLAQLAVGEEENDWIVHNEVRVWAKVKEGENSEVWRICRLCPNKGQ